VVCPPPLGETGWGEDSSGAPAKSALLAARFAAVADELGFELIDLGETTRCLAIDGIHLDTDGHAAVARLVERTLCRVFPQ
jgi:lysophospholipase L1-like esterase